MTKKAVVTSFSDTMCALFATTTSHVESRPINHVTEFAVHASVYGKVQNRLAHSSPRPLAVAYTHDAYFRPRHSSLTLQKAHRLIYASDRQMQSILAGCWPSEAFGVTESQVYS